MMIHFNVSGESRKAMVKAIEDDAAEVAAEHCGEVECYGDEWVAQTRSGEEIARWEIL